MMTWIVFPVTLHPMFLVNFEVKMNFMAIMVWNNTPALSLLHFPSAQAPDPSRAQAEPGRHEFFVHFDLEMKYPTIMVF
jgi:hypothetical protein